MSELPGVSIVIPNYNYAQFVAAAIESALAQDHPRCEVIVVDDASTDGSREVIGRYAERVRTVFLPVNGGQVAALNSAWPLARHELLIFLDSDDLLAPHAASMVARSWAPGVVKVQFPMTSIDADGRSLNHVAPKYPAQLDTGMIRRQLLETGISPTSQGSGNAYAKWLLEKLAPVEGLSWMDALLEVNAPFYGEVITVLEPLACYRMHGANDSQQNEVSADRFVRYLQSFETKLAYFQRRCATWQVFFDAEAARDRSIWYFERALAAAKLTPRSDAARRPPLQLLGRALRAVPRSSSGLGQRALVMVWMALVTLLPRGLARRVIAARFVVTSRPRWLEVIVGLTSQVGSQTTAARPVDAAPRTTGLRVALRSLPEASRGNACIPAAQVPRCE